jgi:hypothetical protein
MAVANWSTTAALNVESTGISGTGGGVGILGTSQVLNFDNALRDIMAQIKTFTTAGAFTGSAFTLTYSDDGAAIGPALTLYRLSTTPAGSDAIGTLRYDGRDSAGNQQTYGDIFVVINDPTSTSEDSTMSIRNIVAGAMVTQIALGATGVTIPNLFTSSSFIMPQTIVATTSGTSIDFTGIPSWVNRITIMFNGVSTSGTSGLRLQLGDAGGAENSGYVGGLAIVSGAPSSTNITDGFGLPTNLANALRYGAITLTRMNAATFTWACTGAIYDVTNVVHGVIAGTKSTSAALDRIRLTTAGGADTFDAGSMNITWE